MLKKICEVLDLGGFLCAEPLKGGYMHRMMDVRTTRGRYAVKLLNPEVMVRSDAPGNFAAAECFERRLEDAGIRMLPALTIGGRKMHRVDGQFLYVFEFFDGRAVMNEEIAPAHCALIGAELVKIHRIDHREGPAPETDAPIDWRALADALLAQQEARASGMLLQSAIPLLAEVDAAANDAIRRMPRTQTICHRDMDAKNVLWRGLDFRIIDLECLGWGSPHQELVELAVSWAGRPISGERFKSFVRAYRDAGGEAAADAAAAFDCRRSDIDWLAWNAVRALSEDAAERALGRSQIGGTIDKIRFDRENRAQVLAWMKEIM